MKLNIRFMLRSALEGAVWAAAFTAFALAAQVGDNPPSVAGTRLKLPIGNVAPVISMGSTHGIILASDGSLWSWGDNFLGWPVLAQGHISTQAVLKRIGDELDWVDVSSSRTHCLALKSDGTMWAWGQNLYAQLGIGPTRDENGRLIRSQEQRANPAPAVPGIDWKQVAAGGSHGLGLKTNGSLWAWGLNYSGQLGLGITNRTVAEATQVGTNTNWRKVWASGLQSVGLQSDGSLWFWGSLTGEGGEKNSFRAPMRVSPETNWSEVGFGYFNAFAIQSDGTLLAWGRDAGIYTDAPIRLFNPNPARVGLEKDWLAISSSQYYYHVLMKKDRSVWIMDASDYATIKPEHEPPQFKRLDLRKDFVAFGAAGRGLGIALTRDGEVWTWGTVLGLPTPENAKRAKRDKPWLLPNIDPDAPRAR
jgi:alpha-tubulin suppressor-like RCC1 family protein